MENAVNKMAAAKAIAVKTADKTEEPEKAGMVEITLLPESETDYLAYNGEALFAGQSGNTLEYITQEPYKTDDISFTVLSQDAGENAAKPVNEQPEELPAQTENAGKTADEKPVETAKFILPDTIPEGGVLLGKWRITGYCACEICCGNYALNRPGGIVRGAAGTQLIAGRSAASSGSLPYASEVYVEGLGQFVIQDRIAQWVTNLHGESIDIYFESHSEAKNFGTKKINVYLKK
jgi:3D (Asp-Asp-Asp) domain-containing protein